MESDTYQNDINLQSFFMKNKVCPLCLNPSAESKSIFSVFQLHWEIHIIECANCHLAYKEYFPRDELISEIYNSNYVHFSTSNYQHLDIFNSRVRRMGKQKGRHLDYGCGNGAFVKSAKQAGWDSIGADPYLNEEVIKYDQTLRLLKLNILDPTAPRRLGKFDCITLWAVMEHVKSIGDVLKRLVDLLDVGGTIIFNSPNPQSLIARRAGSVWRMATLVEHIQFISPICINWLEKSFSLKTVKLRISGAPYPCGKGDRSLYNQGIIDLPKSACKSTRVSDLSRNDISGSHSIIQRVYSEIYRMMFTTSSSNLSSELIRNVINITHLGDHVEVVLQKA